VPVGRLASFHIRMRQASRRTSRRAEAVPPPEKSVREAHYAEERSTQGALALWVWLEDFRQAAAPKRSHREFKHEHQVELSESAIYPMRRSTVPYSGCQAVRPHAAAEALIDEGDADSNGPCLSENRMSF
jgi:hypothetical protein